MNGVTAEDIFVINSLQREMERVRYELDNISSIEEPSKRGLGYKAIPAREGVEIEAATGGFCYGTIIISADGPFVATSIHFAMRYVDTDLRVEEGYWRPTSVTQFEFDYKVSGTKRRRQNIRFPSYPIAQAELGNGYFPLHPHDVFAKTATIDFTIYPIANIENGEPPFFEDPTEDTNPFRMWVGFNGFYVLD